MKNKNILPIVFLCFIVIAVSLFSMTSLKKNVSKLVTDNNQQNEIITFYWEKGEKPILMMKASEEVAIGAIDLYVGYKNVEIANVANLGELPEPAFSKVSEKNSMVVLNYLISDELGFKVSPEKNIKLIELDISSEIIEGAELFIDQKTNIVDNNTIKGLPYKSENLIINSSTLE